MHSRISKILIAFFIIFLSIGFTIYYNYSNLIDLYKKVFHEKSVNIVTSSVSDILNTPIVTPTSEDLTGSTMWGLRDTIIVADPIASLVPILHIGFNYSIIFTGSTTFVSSKEWYSVSLTFGNTYINGWIPVNDVSLTSPGSDVVFGGIDMISSDLDKYLSNLGDSISVTVYDVKNKKYYTYNKDTPFIMASSVKVPIMLAFLDMKEINHTSITNDEMNTLKRMIENSDNDAASTLYNKIGLSKGLDKYLTKIGITDIHININTWGYSTGSSLAMVNLLRKLNEGSILNSKDRLLATTLMRNVESDQRFGVQDIFKSDTMGKDGWVIGPNNLWNVNSSGIVIGKINSYIVSVYTKDQKSFILGKNVLTQVYSLIAKSISLN